MIRTCICVLNGHFECNVSVLLISGFIMKFILLCMLSIFCVVSLSVAQGYFPNPYQYIDVDDSDSGSGFDFNCEFIFCGSTYQYHRQDDDDDDYHHHHLFLLLYILT